MSETLYEWPPLSNRQCVLDILESCGMSDVFAADEIHLEQNGVVLDRTLKQLQQLYTFAMVERDYKPTGEAEKCRKKADEFYACLRRLDRLLDTREISGLLPIIVKQFLVETVGSRDLMDRARHGRVHGDLIIHEMQQSTSNILEAMKLYYKMLDEYDNMKPEKQLYYFLGNKKV